MSVVSSTHMQPLNKLRVAFIGSICSGKTHALELLQRRLLEMNLDISCQRLSMTTILYNEFGHDGIASHDTSHTLRCEYLISKLYDKINEDRDVVMVDGIRYNEEVLFLKQRGFKIVMLHTPWHVRLKRIQCKYTNVVNFIQNVQWMTHSSEMDMNNIDGCDHVVVGEDGVSAIVEKLIGSI
jgi:hypothetical protein